MGNISWLQRLCLTRFSRPAAERPLVRHLLERPAVQLLELGVGSGERCCRLLKLMKQLSPGAERRYVGVDLFEASTDGRPHAKLKDVYRMVAQEGVRPNLIPGEPLSSVARVAHTFHPSQLVVVDGLGLETIGEGGDLASWIPRLVAEDGALFWVSPSDGSIRQIPHRRDTTDTLRRAA